MGSWNGTCGITQLPILAGDPVLGIVIRPPDWYQKDTPRSTNISGYCYTHGMYYPVTLFFKGTYDDYGGIENLEETFLNDIHNEVVTKGLIEDMEDDVMAKYDGGGVKKENSFIEKLNYMERERYFVRGSYTHVDEVDNTKVERIDVRVPMGLWMVRKDVIDHVLSDGVMASQKNIHQTFMEAGYRVWKETALKVQEELDAISKDDPDREDRLKCIRLLAQLQSESGNSKKILESLEGKISEKDLLYNNHVARTLLTAPNVAYSGGPSAYGEKLKQLLVDGKEDEARHVGDKLIEFELIHSLMSRARIGFHPQSGKGSQSSCFTIHKELAAAITKVAEANKKYDYY